MKRVAVKFDLEKLKQFGFEIYSNDLRQANDLGFLTIYDKTLLSNNENLYNIVTLYYKERNLVKFKLTFYLKDKDCNVYDKDLMPFINIDNGLLCKVNANNFDYDYMMFKLGKEDLLQLVEEYPYV